MIYVHTYYTDKFNSVKHVRVYEDLTQAVNQQKVLGGTVQSCEIIEEF